MSLALLFSFSLVPILFNSASKLSYWLAAPSCVLVFVVLYLIFWFRLGNGSFYMDPQDAVDDPKGAEAWKFIGRTFEPILARYYEIAKLVITLAVGSIAVLSGYVG